MDESSSSKKRASPSSQSQSSTKLAPPSYRTAYLILYNFVSAVLWGAVLGRVLLIAPLHGYKNVYVGAGELVKWTQTLAALEILHSLTGVVRAPLLTTAMQVASRFLLVWGVVAAFPGTTTRSPAYSSMLVAWSITEVIRYSYFAVNLAYGRVPAALTWLRYNTFFVLYPLGISSECWLVWRSIEPASRMGVVWPYVLQAVLFIYVPGAYILFTHMMAQRRKVMRGATTKKIV